MSSEVLHKLGAEFVQQIKSQFDQKRLNDRGGAKNSISYTVEDQRLVIHGLARVLFINFGRRPGTPPPFEVIKEWVERKLDVEPEGVWIVTKTIVDKIAEKGTDILTDRAKGLELELILGEMIRQLSEMVIIFEANAMTDALINTWENGTN